MERAPGTLIQKSALEVRWSFEGMDHLMGCSFANLTYKGIGNTRKRKSVKKLKERATKP